MLISKNKNKKSLITSSNILTSSLVIVESPAKCKKIEEYLGPGYKCIATYGHFREIKSINDIHLDTLNISFTVTDELKKKKNIEFLREQIKKADEVILATDGDREGEAIAWHICDTFNLPISSTKRIIFNEITESAILHAIHNPSKIDMYIVQAQKTRQILDMLVGFKISPILWKYISKNSENSLSAGRCQTPALKLIYDNYKEIKESPGKPIYNIKAYFTSSNIPFELNKTYEDNDDVILFLEESVNHSHLFSIEKPVTIYKEAPFPFTTSKIQQACNNTYHLSPKETMKICQKLYENGLITYMRTDSKKYSKSFIESVSQLIKDNYQSDKYLRINMNDITCSNSSSIKEEQEIKNNEEDKISILSNLKKPKVKSNVKNNKNPEPQEAHEAIRPTNINTHPSSTIFTSELKYTSKEKNVYKLIWENTVQSCMSSAEYNTIKSKVSAFHYEPQENNMSPKEKKEPFFINTSEICIFKGWQIIGNQKENISEKHYHLLEKIKQGTNLPYKLIKADYTLVDLKHHYTESKLVQLLEEKGIGRPSTFSMLIDKIQERGYVKKEDITGKTISCTNYELVDCELTEKSSDKVFGNEKNKLVLQPKGLLVIEFLINHFSELFDYDYTKNMESKLDEIASEKKLDNINEYNFNKAKELCDDCITTISSSMENLKEENKVEIKIDDVHSYIIGKHGPVIKSGAGKNVQFKKIRENIDMDKLQSGGYTLEELVDENGPEMTKTQNIILGKYQNEDLLLKKGKYGLYVSWGENKKSLSCYGNRPIDNITYEEVLLLLEKENENGILNPENLNKNVNIIREVTDNITIRKGRYGDYVYFKKKNMKNPQFFKLSGFVEDYKKCNKILIKNWLFEKYGIF
jgi:DNA topoisomerase-1